ncbi:21463_t:CDS:2 [Gigaspora margarita]|uniref:21463_t:CDS:1 n=1 Tax=Gigaspora margarita TaxID=4874 RepID=A0ABM8W2H9_GIGMA|nr:21463_t:CDS:2 [Gigaspora margarita]
MSNDKRKKEWILFKESGKTEVGRISKKRDKNKIKIEHWNRDDDLYKKAIDKKLIRKSNKKVEHELLVPIKLFNFKLSINEVTTKQIKKEPAVSYLVIELLEERMLKECIKGKEAGNKEFRKYRKEMEMTPGPSHQASITTQPNDKIKNSKPKG